MACNPIKGFSSPINHCLSLFTVCPGQSILTDTPRSHRRRPLSKALTRHPHHSFLAIFLCLLPPLSLSLSVPVHSHSHLIKVCHFFVVLNLFHPVSQSVSHCVLQRHVIRQRDSRSSLLNWQLNVFLASSTPTIGTSDSFMAHHRYAISVCVHEARRTSSRRRRRSGNLSRTRVEEVKILTLLSKISKLSQKETKVTNETKSNQRTCQSVTFVVVVFNHIADHIRWF